MKKFSASVVLARAGILFPDLFREKCGGIHLRESDQDVPANQAELCRNMWCSVGFFHAAGKSIAAVGEMLAHDHGGAEQVFTFDPIEIQCDANGTTNWSPAAVSTERHILLIR